MSLSVDAYQHKTEADELRAERIGGRQDGRAALAVGLVRMNGHVYDPVLGRFPSTDPFNARAGTTRRSARRSSSVAARSEAANSGIDPQ